MPNVVLFDDRLSSGAKLLYCYLNSLSAKDGTCYPKNKHLGEKFGISTRQVSRLLDELITTDYVMVRYADQDTQTGRRFLDLYFRGGMTKMSRGVDKNVMGGMTKMSAVTDANNITYKYNLNKEIDAETTASVDRIYRLFLSRFVADPNDFRRLPKEEHGRVLDAASKKYRLTPKRRDKIVCRLKDAGYEMIQKALLYCAEDDFFRGENDKRWSADLEWLCKSYENIEKYANKADKAAGR